MNPTVQFLVFIVGFLLILAVFIRLIQISEKRLGGKLPAKRHGVIEGIIIAGIVIGILMMFQPLTLSLFEPGFLLLVASTLAFTLWSHVLPGRRHMTGPKDVEQIEGIERPEAVEHES